MKSRVITGAFGALIGALVVGIVALTRKHIARQESFEKKVNEVDREFRASFGTLPK